jgi:hypothetical protein
LTRVVAVDWSGRAKRPEESIWTAEVRDGRLVDLHNGRTGGQVVEWLGGVAEEEPRTVVGFDFAFSFPRWWCEEQGWVSGREVWAAMAKRGEALLAAGQSPFWGRPGRLNTLDAGRLYRRTDREGDGAAKSVFQIGGPGAVGTGSIRGMPHLLTLAERGFCVWPFEGPGWPLVVEIYPRALTGPVVKSRWTVRHEWLLKRFPDQPCELLERAAGSEDAFDAAVSALAMGRHADELAALPRVEDSIEGRIWRPAPLGPAPRRS